MIISKQLILQKKDENERTYKVEIEYDEQGRIKSAQTYQDKATGTRGLGESVTIKYNEDGSIEMQPETGHKIGNAKVGGLDVRYPFIIDTEGNYNIKKRSGIKSFL